MIRIYTSGSSKPDGSGLGILLISDEVAKKVRKALKNETHNRAELLAILYALGELKVKEKVEIYISSDYCIDVLTKSCSIRKNGDIIYKIKALLLKCDYEIKKLNPGSYKNLVKRLSDSACSLNQGEVKSEYLKPANIFSNNFITIYTDASRDPNSGESSFAYYAKIRGETVKNSGRLGVTRNSNHAEMLAIKTSILECIDQGPDGFFINTDSLSCCQILWPFYKVNSRDKVTSSVANDILKLLEEKNIWLRVKHVKAHTQNTDIRSYLNRYCDTQAKRSMGN